VTAIKTMLVVLLTTPNVKEYKELILSSLPNPFPPQRAIEKPQINIQIFDCLFKLNTSQVFGD